MKELRATLADVKGLMAGSQIFISNDNGPAQLAGACGIGAIETSEVIAAIESLKKVRA